MKTFLDEFPKYHEAKFVVLPVPYEATTSYGKGTKNGPKAIIKASEQVEGYIEELDFEPYTKAGIYTHRPLKRTEIFPIVKKVLNNHKVPILLGGEHSLSIEAVRAAKDCYPDLSVLQLDAHADLRDSYLGRKDSHACTMRRILEVCPAVQVGIRSVDIEEAEWAKGSGQWEKIVFASQLTTNNLQLTTIKSNLTNQVYITIDVDVFDPSIMPSTGTPEPGGLSWLQVIEILRIVTQAKKVVGFDVVEFSPIKGFHAPDFTIAKLVYRLMGYLVKK